MLFWMEAYRKHAALNFGQAAQGVRFLLSHSDVDSIAPPGTVRHALHALPLRLKRVANDLFFALLPPQWHHSRAELEMLRPFPARFWFQAGYGPYRFSETGGMLPQDEWVREPRWDPRCKD